MNSNKVWFITGGNKGIGAAIVKEALGNGYNVIAAARNIDSAKETLGHHPNLLIVKLDITNNEDVNNAVKAALDRFGRIDVLINNAGYGLLGYFEEMSETSIRKQIETNLFGTMKISRAILPVMRKQGSGFVVVVSSTSGIKAVAGSSVYSASKFALEGWVEGMNIDMKSFGIGFMLLEPGAFRTDFANENASMQLPDLEVEGYSEARENLAQIFHTMNGNQAGDPAKLARGLVKVVKSENPPLRLLISKGAIPAVETYYKTRFAEFEHWKEVSVDSDFDK
ncbi:SDR family NAD(P)-dependent oxidoreductase [Mucilaginibacter sabulilitoris]|uniref:SDR family NAD(P)-dependent oxidoreductase n=1 Tax=Mucilaginibacter sabulilitoris TaxID=1173583 RepID=A0ABZ0TPM0_9SPHI|nr:SDR family NAD(P)-dependent oxidoreductase [Mucilaginibacter sabulilitoris]WPU93679.1 SDR family NAD(P)-dependent oxidoreductase [Mucilaginibacter sabulilitoris]